MVDSGSFFGLIAAILVFPEDRLMEKKFKNVKLMEHVPKCMTMFH